MKTETKNIIKQHIKDLELKLEPFEKLPLNVVLRMPGHAIQTIKDNHLHYILSTINETETNQDDKILAMIKELMSPPYTKSAQLRVFMNPSQIKNPSPLEIVSKYHRTENDGTELKGALAEIQQHLTTCAKIQTEKGSSLAITAARTLKDTKTIDYQTPQQSAYSMK